MVLLGLWPSLKKTEKEKIVWRIGRRGEGGHLGRLCKGRRTVGLVADARLDAGDAVAEAGLGGAQARVRDREMFEIL